jgi:hypothetical protein
VRAPMNGTGAQRRRQWLPMREPSVLVLALGVVQLAREVAVLLRKRSRTAEILVLIIRGKEAR